jgi:hypothetical protein
MRQSRYVWILGLSVFCLFAIVMFQTPQTVISTMSDPQFQGNPRTTIQHFWSLMDLRQTGLAKELLQLPEGSSDDQEFKSWEATLNKDPLLSLQKVEFLNPEVTSTKGIIVQVTWKSTIQTAQTVTYTMNLKPTDNGWRIQQMKRINIQSSS